VGKQQLRDAIAGTAVRAARQGGVVTVRRDGLAVDGRYPEIRSPRVFHNIIVTYFAGPAQTNATVIQATHSAATASGGTIGRLLPAVAIRTGRTMCA
jgi:hypothetical protein